jgi:hypothetical protein
MLVSPATVTRVNAEGLDEHEAAKTSIKIEPNAIEILLRVANLDVPIIRVLLPENFVECTGLNV